MDTKQAPNLVSAFSPGDQAPDAIVLSEKDKPVHLESVWKSHNGPTVLVFFRHFGCIFCRQHAAELQKHLGEFRERNAQVVAIGIGAPTEAREFRDDRKLSFPILADPDRAGYKAFGLPEGTVRQLAGPRVAAAGIRATLQGASVGRSTGNRRQLPGTYIVNPEGTIMFAKPAAHAGDVASVTELLTALDVSPSAISQEPAFIAS